MRGKVALIGVVAAALLAPSAGAAPVDRDVLVKFQRFTLHQTIAITGDSVTWTNDEDYSSPLLANHNVTSDDGGFIGGQLDKGTTLTRSFMTPGTFGYHCSIHQGMHGMILVSDLYLARPGLAATHGKSVILTGYAETGASVDVNRVGGSANPLRTVWANGSTGKFSVSIPAVPGYYQADISDTTMSAQVRLNVKPKLNVKSRKKNGKYTITVSTGPNQAGGKIVLERKSGSKWKAISTHTLPAASKTAFKVKPTATMKVRLRLSVAKNGYSKTTSGTLTLRK